MLAEYEIELLRANLAEIQCQLAADAEARALQQIEINGPRLLARLYSLFRFDPTQLPTPHPSALRLQSHLWR